MPISQTCIDSAVIVILTASVSGFLIPLILKRVEHRKAIEQKRTEAELARQQKVIDAQSLFLDTISDLLWRWRYLCIKVTYYGSETLTDKYPSSKDEYDRDIWSHFHAIRTQISKARRLVSDAAYDELLKFYKSIVAIDNEMKEIALLPEIERPLQYTKLNQRLYEDISAQIDQRIDALARGLQLDRVSTNAKRE